MALTSAQIVPATSVRPIALLSRRKDAAPDDRLMIAMFIERARLRSAGTARVYHSAVERFLAWHGGRLAEVRYQEIIAYQALSDRDGGLNGFAPATVARHIATLRALFRLAVDTGYLDHDPTKLATLPKVPAVPQTWLSESEIASMVKAASEAIVVAAGRWERTQARRNLALILLACTTGCRSAELAALSWADIYRDPHGLIGMRVRGKGGKTREVKLLPAVWNALAVYRAELGMVAGLPAETESSPMFVNRHGERLSALGNYRIIRDTAAKAGISKPVSPHAVRRGMATAALKGGASLRQVQAQLGHSNLATTQRYLFELDGLKDTAADYLGKLTEEFRDED